MKYAHRSFLFLVALVSVTTMLLSACGAATAPAARGAPGSAKVDASIIAFTGTIESMNGNEWVINGQTLSVDPATVRGGPFQVGDQVKVEGVVNPDGTLTVSSVESPSAADLIETLTPADNANANTNDANVNNANDNDNDDDDDDNINNANNNDDDDEDGQTVSNANTNGSHDDHSHDDDGNDNSGGSDDESDDDD